MMSGKLKVLKSLLPLYFPQARSAPASESCLALRPPAWMWQGWAVSWGSWPPPWGPGWCELWRLPLC